VADNGRGETQILFSAQKTGKEVINLCSNITTSYERLPVIFGRIVAQFIGKPIR
jgi:hypothetical protein